jgi:phosphate starvation-inducible PhoH-like protein
VLEQLYGRLAQGEMIGVGEVVGAIRHARTPAQVAEVAEAEAKDAKDAKVPAAQQIRTRKRLITARTPAQSTYLSALQSHDLVFATGPAGTGKTYLAVAFAAACMESGKCDRLILSRPSRLENGSASFPATCARRSIPICARFTMLSMTCWRQSGSSAGLPRA